MGFSLPGGFCRPGIRKKGAQSSGPNLGSQAQKSSAPYPQKVWITLWVAALARPKKAEKCANPLAWSNNDHDIKHLLINDLRHVHSATELKPAVIPLIECPSRGICA